jgi:hypothetical protein
MNMYIGAKVLLHLFLILKLSASRTGLFPPEENVPNIHRMGGSVDTRAGLNAAEYIELSYTCRKSNPRPLASSSKPVLIPVQLSRLY